MKSQLDQTIIVIAKSKT